MAKLYQNIYIANPYDINKSTLFDGRNVNLFAVDILEKSEINTYILDDWDTNSLYLHPMSVAEDTMKYSIMQKIFKCDVLFLYLNQVKTNIISTIELTIAAMTEKPCYIIANFGESMEVYDYDSESGISSRLEPNCSIYEDCLLLNSFDESNLAIVDSTKKAKETIKKILLLESPIEKLLLDKILENSSTLNPLECIEPQYNIDRYRIDFAYPKYKIAIELDGHDYHKTKEQRTKDAKKDRFLIKCGWEVLRFTGTEIFKDTDKCLYEITERIISKQKNFHGASEGQL